MLERDELKHKVNDLEVQVQDSFQKNRDLQLENDEIPILRDSLEEMKYLESKVVSGQVVSTQTQLQFEFMEISIQLTVHPRLSEHDMHGI